MHRVYVLGIDAFGLDKKVARIRERLCAKCRFLVVAWGLGRRDWRGQVPPPAKTIFQGCHGYWGNRVGCTRDQLPGVCGDLALVVFLKGSTRGHHVFLADVRHDIDGLGGGEEGDD